MSAYFIDTNYLLRLLVRDNEAQFETAYNLFKQGEQGTHQLFTSTLVLFEVYWVLTEIYHITKEQCLASLRDILSMGFLTIENHTRLWYACQLFSTSNADLVDCYHIACTKELVGAKLASFDKKALKVFQKS